MSSRAHLPIERGFDPTTLWWPQTEGVSPTLKIYSGWLQDGEMVDVTAVPTELS